MIKGKKTSTTLVLSVLVLLIALFMSFINMSYAWFTDGKVGNTNKSLYLYINTAEVNLGVYQRDSADVDTRLNTLNSDITEPIKLYYDSANATNNLIVPGVSNNLKLVLKNEDLGVTFGVRFKVEFYAVTAQGRVKLTSKIEGMDAPTNSQNGFKFDTNNGYYYYQNNDGTKVAYEQATKGSTDDQIITNDRIMMTSFTIIADETFYSLTGGDSIIMVVEVENVDIENV